MKYDIYFHNDFDGRACAAVMLAFLRSRGDDIEHCTAVNYYLQAEWLDERFFEKHTFFKGKRNPAIVVDFLYHPKAAWWFDHHPTTFKKEAWGKNYKADKQHSLKPQYPSCTHLVLASLEKNFAWHPPKHIVELVKWLDVIDGANYRSARQTIEVKEPALQVDEFIERKAHSSAEDARIIDLLSRLPLKNIAALPEVKKFVSWIKKEDKKGLVFCRENARIVGGVCSLDRSKSALKFPHFALQYLFPRIVYFIRISERDGLYHINLGVSPWKRDKSTIRVDRILKQFGGGGHKDVGGVEFKTHSEALSAMSAIIAIINRSPEHA